MAVWERVVSLSLLCSDRCQGLVKKDQADSSDDEGCGEQCRQDYPPIAYSPFVADECLPYFFYCGIAVGHVLDSASLYYLIIYRAAIGELAEYVPYGIDVGAHIEAAPCSCSGAA